MCLFIRAFELDKIKMAGQVSMTFHICIPTLWLHNLGYELS